MQKAFKAFAQQGEIVGLEGVAGLFQGCHGVVQGLLQVAQVLRLGWLDGTAVRGQQAGVGTAENLAVDAGSIEQTVSATGLGGIEAEHL